MPRSDLHVEASPVRPTSDNFREIEWTWLSRGSCTPRCPVKDWTILQSLCTSVYRKKKKIGIDYFLFASRRVIENWLMITLFANLVMIWLPWWFPIEHHHTENMDEGRHEHPSRVFTLTSLTIVLSYTPTYKMIYQKKKARHALIALYFNWRDFNQAT